MGCKQRVDTVGGGIEGGRHRGDLVPPVDPRAATHFTRPPGFDASPQRLKSSGYPRHDGIGREGDDRGNGQQHLKGVHSRRTQVHTHRHAGRRPHEQVGNGGSKDGQEQETTQQGQIHLPEQSSSNRAFHFSPDPAPGQRHNLHLGP